MQNTSTVAPNSSRPEACPLGPGALAALSLVDIGTFLAGQPVIANLLWITVTCKRPDVLNYNLALFHNLQYLTSVLHLSCLFLLPSHQEQINTFLIVYVQIGGPMSLFFVFTERWVAVARPTSYPLLRKYRYRELCAWALWLCAVPTAVVNVFTLDKLPFFREKVVQTVPIFVMVTMTAMMAWTSISTARGLKRSSPGGDGLHPSKRRAFNVVCATSTTALVCYTLVTLMERVKFVNEYRYNCIFTPVCIVLLCVASVVHPLFYLSTQGKLMPCLRKFNCDNNS